MTYPFSLPDAGVRITATVKLYNPAKSSAIPGHFGRPPGSHPYGTPGLASALAPPPPGYHPVRRESIRSGPVGSRRMHRRVPGTSPSNRADPGLAIQGSSQFETDEGRHRTCCSSVTPVTVLYCPTRLPSA